MEFNTIVRFPNCFAIKLSLEFIDLIHVDVVSVFYEANQFNQCYCGRNRWKLIALSLDDPKKIAL